MTGFPSRRELLFSAGAVALTGIAAVGAALDTIVVGAGVAGIAAARTLRARGRTVLLLEAADRIGGRAFTDTSMPVPFDAGAAFFSGIASGNGAFYDVATALGTRSTAASDAPFGVAGGDGSAFSATYAALLSALLARGERVHDGLLEDTTVYEALRALRHLPHFGAALALLRVEESSHRAASVADYHAVTSGFPAPFVFPARDTRFVPSGMGALVARLAHGLPIVLGSPVMSIAYGDGAVTVRTGGGRTYRARRAIVTVSTGVLASRGIEFSPALPERYTSAIAALPMHPGYRAAISFTRPVFGVRAGCVRGFADLHLQLGLAFHVHGSEAPVVTFAADGAQAQTYENMPQAEVSRAFLSVLDDAFPGARAAWSGDIRASAWGKNPFVRGANTYATMGNSGARAVLAQPLGKTLCFAGEALARAGTSGVNAAWVSGMMAARLS
jgi:monoamine oxidase